MPCLLRLRFLDGACPERSRRAQNDILQQSLDVCFSGIILVTKILVENMTGKVI